MPQYTGFPESSNNVSSSASAPSATSLPRVPPSSQIFYNNQPEMNADAMLNLPQTMQNQVFIIYSSIVMFT